MRELRDLADPVRIPVDLREQRFVAHTLQIAVQAALDVASHIVSARRLGEPETHRMLFERLRRDGWIDDPLAASLQAMAGFRNVVVHGYQALDPGILVDIVEHHLDDLVAFAAAVRARLKP